MWRNGCVERVATGGYGEELGAELCERISADLFETTEDKHLRLHWHESREASEDEAALVAAMRERFRLENYGVRRVELLPDNIGLIELTLILSPSDAAPALTAAMELVAHTNALILDLRGALGGSPDGVAFLCSYLLPDGDVHLSDVVEDRTGRHASSGRRPTCPVAATSSRPVYVLTSSTTFSGGEELAYDLQVLRRATIVGETTRGGAHLRRSSR